MAPENKMQSAIEYLQTYAWAFIILAIVVAVLAYFGIFGMNTKLRLPPGSCFVNRPYGPNTTQFLSLSGNCNGDLPEYVIHFNGRGSAWNMYACGVSLSTCIVVPSPFAGQLVCNATVSLWSYDLGIGGNGGGWSPGEYGASYGQWYDGGGAAQPAEATLGGTFALYNGVVVPGDIDIEYNDTLVRFEARNYQNRNQAFVQGNFKGRWINTVVTLDNGIAVGYINGVQVTQNSPDIGCINLNGGVVGTWDAPFNGFVTNIQVYNTALDANTIASMYKYGAGGVPLDLLNLVAWWQLNGNSNDSSGNQGSGTVNDLSYNNNYPAPQGSGG